MQTTIKLNTSQLDANFLEAIKKLFKDQDVEINIRSFYADDTDYLFSSKANRSHLEESIAEYKEKQTETFELEEFYTKYESLLVDE